MTPDKSNLIYFNCFNLLDHHKDFPGMEKWNWTRDIWAKNATFLDRTGQITLPVNYKILDWCKMPKFVQINDTFEQVCNERASEIFKAAREGNKDIAIMWSGGIDSTCMLTSFLKVGTPDDINRLIILLDRNSQTENFHFYNTYIKFKLRLAPSNLFENYINDNTIFVTGEGGDQITTAEYNNAVALELGNEGINAPATADNIIKSCALRTTQERAEFIYSILQRLIDHAPVQVKTVFQTFWYANFNVKWQSVYFRLLGSMNKAKYSVITESYLRNNFLMFYGSDKFQQWVVSNWDAIPPKDIRYTKLPLREVIFDFDKNESYFHNKRKIGSLSHIVRAREWQCYVNEDYQVLDRIDPTKYMNPNNSFL